MATPVSETMKLLLNQMKNPNKKGKNYELKISGKSPIDNRAIIGTPKRKADIIS